MGKRKSKARVMKKERAAVGTVFDCPFCNHKHTVECKMNYQTSLGTLKCRVCAVNFQSEIHHLSDPIDVYSEWIDSCEDINKKVAVDRGGGGGDGEEDEEERQERAEQEEFGGGDLSE